MLAISEPSGGRAALKATNQRPGRRRSGCGLNPSAVSTGAIPSTTKQPPALAGVELEVRLMTSASHGG